MKWFKLAVPVLALAVLPAGCTPYQPPTTVGTIEADDPEYVMVVVLDMSGSYAQYIDDGRAWKAMNQMMRQFFRERSGENDKIIIAQISSAPQGPIWSGSPKAFRSRFGGSTAFRDYLRQYGGSSRVFDSITEAVEYAAPMMGKGRAGCFIFSDMDDNLSQAGGEGRLVNALAEFGKKGGSVGIYWCGFRETSQWRTHLQGKVKHFVVSSDIDADPRLPTFE